MVSLDSNRIPSGRIGCADSWQLRICNCGLPIKMDPPKVGSLISLFGTRPSPVGADRLCRCVQLRCNCGYQPRKLAAMFWVEGSLRRRNRSLHGRPTCGSRNVLASSRSVQT